MSRKMVVMMVLLGILLPAFAPAAFAQGPQEGIKVHGHWVIDVRNPDGALASHTEVENALTPGGSSILALLLGRTMSTVRGWNVTLSPVDGSPFGVDPVFPQTARIFEAAFGDAYGSTGNNVNRFGTLVVAQVYTTVVLKGTATAVADGQIGRVQTELMLAFAGGNQVGYDFSGTFLPSAVPLSAGQSIQITVTLSFS